MRPMSFMVVAGEASGDRLAAELVMALREGFEREPAPISEDLQPLQSSLRPRYYGAGGVAMANAGVELAFDLTEHAVVGLQEVLRNIWRFKRLFDRLYWLALDREPDVIVLVDYSGFNRRFAATIRRFARRRGGVFRNWDPKVVYYVSPQVWASRPGRAYQLARDVDLLLSIFPFEKEWYAERVPNLPVRYVGHPVIDRYGVCQKRIERARDGIARVTLLPGSRAGELKRHVPLLVEAARLLKAERAVEFEMVLPNEKMRDFVRGYVRDSGEIKLRAGDVGASLEAADLALASTGTVTLECACFRVPTVAFYRTSASTYWIGKVLIRVPYLAMPNLLAGEMVYPEFIQGAATPENLAREAKVLLDDAARREEIDKKLKSVIELLGSPGAAARAAREIIQLLRR